MSGFQGYDAWKTAHPPEWDEDLCEVCGEPVDNCECAECPICGEQGNPDCQINGGDICQAGNE